MASFLYSSSMPQRILRYVSWRVFGRIFSVLVSVNLKALQNGIKLTDRPSKPSQVSTQDSSAYIVYPHAIRSTTQAMLYILLYMFRPGREPGIIADLFTNV